MSPKRFRPVVHVESARASLIRLARDFPIHEDGAKMDTSVFAANCWVRDGDPFDVSLTFRGFPHMKISHGRVTPSIQRWSGYTPSEHVQVGIVLRGEVEFSTRDASTRYRAGDLYVYPRWAWVRTRVLEETEFVHIAATARTLLERSVDISPQALSRPLNSPLSEQLRAIAMTTLNVGSRSREDDVVVDRVMVVLLQAILAEQQDRQIAPSLGTLRQRAEEVIETRHTDPALHPVELAKTLRVSLRQLQRAFTATGSSPAERLRERRTATAIDLLSIDASGTLTVSKVAHLSGFSSTYALRAAVYAALGTTPQELRVRGTPHPGPG